MFTASKNGALDLVPSQGWEVGVLQVEESLHTSWYSAY